MITICVVVVYTIVCAYYCRIATGIADYDTLKYHGDDRMIRWTLTSNLLVLPFIWLSPYYMLFPGRHGPIHLAYRLRWEYQNGELICTILALAAHGGVIGLIWRLL